MCIHMVFFFQAEDGIRDLVRSRGLGDVYKRQPRPDRPDQGQPGAGAARPDRGSQDFLYRSPQPLTLSLIHI